MNKIKKIRLGSATPSISNVNGRMSRGASFDIDGDSEIHDTMNNVGTLAILDDDDFFTKHTKDTHGGAYHRKNKRHKTRILSKKQSTRKPER